MIIFTHLVKKRHSQSTYLNKIYQTGWFSKFTVKFLGNFQSFFREAGDTGQFFSMFKARKQGKRSTTSYEQASKLLASTNLKVAADWDMRYGLRGGNFKIDQSEARRAFKNMTNSGIIQRLLRLLEICHSSKKKGHFQPIFEPPLRSNEAMKSKPIEQWKILNSISYRKVTAYVWSNR